MEIRELAERVLFGGRLEDKLHRPAMLSDEQPGRALDAPSFPARPPGLEFLPDPARPRIAFPSPSSLESEERRGTVLHFFANHELLAMELMALTLLRHPEAPQALRRTLAQTLRDEQEHLGLYLDRMKEFGVEFGGIPVNRFFWDSLASVNRIDAFLAGMSLSFEQANLDYALFYREIFDTLGDEETSALLTRVYEDEIRHVRHGLGWFRKLHDGEELWDAWLTALPRGLGTEHAQGRVFSREARRRAGLDEGYIERLELSGGTRSRPPRLFLFDGACEEDVGRERPQTARGARELQADLETTPLFLAGRRDLLLVDEEPRTAHLRELKDAGFAIPRILTRSLCSLDQRLGTELLSDLCPWGWSPRIADQLRPLRHRLRVGKDRNPPLEWSPELAALHSKAWAAGVAERWLDVLDLEPSNAEWIALKTRARTAESPKQVIAILEEGLAGPHEEFILKAPFSSAGRHRRRVRELPLSDELQGWIERVLDDFGTLVIEPWTPRLADVAFHFDVRREDGRVRLSDAGTSRFLTLPKGQYLGNVVGSPIHGFPESIRRLLYARGDRRSRLDGLVASLASQLETELAPIPYEGPLGIDAFFFQTPEGPRLRPLVEMNARWSMGRIAHRFRRRLSPSRQGIWLHLPLHLLVKAGLSVEEFVTTLRRDAPPRLTGPDHDRRLQDGAVFTTDPTRARQLLTVLVVEEATEVVGRLLPEIAPLLGVRS